MCQKIAYFRFYEELNDFLPAEKKKVSFPYCFNGSPTVKDAIENQGVPHTEVDLILVNGESVGFDQRLHHGDRISVYPIFESLDITPVLRLRAKPLRHMKFIVDVHLGKLSRLLRMLGFDTLYRNDYQDSEIIHVAKKEKRIILTRDRGILKNNAVTHGYWIRSIVALGQLKEVLHRFDLFSKIHPFQRCIACNGQISPAEKQKILYRLQPKTIKYYETFYQCDSCGKVYWKGSHFLKMNALVRRLVAENEQNKKGERTLA